jgi:ABC-type Fe3+ transport system permease subunit
MDVTIAAPEPPRRRSRFRWRRWLRKAAFAFSVVVIVSPAILVFLWMLSLSLKNEIDNITYPPVFIPSPPTFANFISVFQQNSMFKYFWNSVVVSGGATLIALAIGIPAGYGIARTGAHRLTVLILIARMTPALSYLIPLFAVFQFLHLNNTLTALVITHLVITVPIVVYIMAGHFETQPRELRKRHRSMAPAHGARSVTSHCRWPDRASSWASFSRSFSRGTTSSSARCWRGARPGRCRSPSNVLTFEQLAWGRWPPRPSS